MIAQVVSFVFASFDLGTMEGFHGILLKKNLESEELALLPCPLSTTHGVKYQIDLSDVAPNSLIRMPGAAIKLSKGVGIWFRRLGDPDMHIVLGGNYPTWLKEGQLVKVLAARNCKWRFGPCGSLHYPTSSLVSDRP
jgi:hypothetical protein